MAYAVRRPVENAYLVRERDRRRTREFAALALAAIPFLLVLLAAIGAHLETVRLGYQLARVARQKESLLERNRRLRMDRAEATALARVDALARARLGLVPPAPDQILRVQDDSLTPAVASVPAPRPAAPPRRAASEGGF